MDHFLVEAGKGQVHLAALWLSPSPPPPPQVSGMVGSQQEWGLVP